MFGIRLSVCVFFVCVAVFLSWLLLFFLCWLCWLCVFVVVIVWFLFYFFVFGFSVFVMVCC